jgi:phosphoglycolate/pyridoxal phosphate phosphatase family enzyme
MGLLVDDPFFAAANAVPDLSGGGKIRLVAADLDGVVWLGGTILPDAPAALHDVVRRGLELRYVTNNSTAHREVVAQRLAACGLPAGADWVLTSAFVTGQWLRRRLPAGAPVLVVGEAGLMRELTEAGLAPVHAGEAAPALAPAAAGGAQEAADAPAAAPYQAVVVGMDRDFTFKALAEAQTAIRSGAVFVGTNPDATFPTATGLLPGAGSVVAAVATAAQKEPVFMGKPGLGLAETLAAVTGVPAGQTLFIGDRLSTDIGMGIRAGMVTALVLTGVTSPDEFERLRATGGPDMPDHVLRTLADLPALLDALGV